MAIFYGNPYTPYEINSMNAEDNQLQTQASIGNAGMGIGLNVAQNLSPAAGFGFLLGNLGGRALNNYLYNKQQKKLESARNAMQIKNMSQGLGQFGQSLIPQAWQNQQPQFQLGKYPTNGQYFSPPNPTPNQYTFQPVQAPTTAQYNSTTPNQYNFSNSLLPNFRKW